MSPRLLPRASYDVLVAKLAEDRELLAPRVRDGAIVWGVVDDASQLPVGVGDTQTAGRYRLRERGDERAFGYAVGPSSLKATLFPPHETLYRAERRADGKVGFVKVAPSPTPRAVLGARACELSALAVQDRVFLHGAAKEPRYATRRESLELVVAVQCGAPAETCFCADTQTGPRVTEGADVVATEVDAGLLLEARSPRGATLLDALPLRPASDDERAAAEAELEDAERATSGRLNVDTLHERLYGALDHPRWDDVAARCLSCGNCTSVCPTCFCSQAEEEAPIADALEGRSDRTRRWESCFTKEHGAMAGHDPRPTTKDRYRQWLTHKLGGWVAQLGASGCVGCGRCTTWCPAGIDFVTEAKTFEEMPRSPLPSAPAPRDDAPEETWVPRVATIRAVREETSDVVTLVIRDDGARPRPGQFLQLSLPAFGEAPISVSGVTDDGEVELTIRGVGALTRALGTLRCGDELGVRGPYGRPWPLDALEGHTSVFVAGGLGLAPLRQALRTVIANPSRFGEVRLFVGARTPDARLYVDELERWNALPHVQVLQTVDHADTGWRGHVGVVPRWLRGRVPPGARALVCGPEIMMRFTSDALRAEGIGDDAQWLTLERHMKCAVGFCGRCQLGPHLICRDGPVFRRDELPLFGREGF
ncbi:MAG: 4Fe-4S dicluster domain-containing protein [Polyangiales bacterium]